MADAVSTKNSSSGKATAISSLRLTDGGPRIIGEYLRSSRPARQAQAIAAAAESFDRFDLLLRIKLAPQSADQNLDHVAVAIEILFIQPFGQIALRDHVAGAQHEMFEDAIFETGQLHRRAAHAHFLGTRVELDGPAGELGAGPAPRAPQQR